MSIILAIGISMVFAINYGKLNADGKQLALILAIIIAGGLAGMRDT